MPQNVQIETPGERTMRQWFQGKLGERLMQAGQMAQDRMLLRRGAAKQQDGTLGTEDGEVGTLGEEMNIRVGDETHYHEAPPAPSSPKPATSLFTKGAVIAALLAGGSVAGVAVERAIRSPQSPPAVETPVDNDTRYESRIEYLE